jgi:peptidoglycan/xylan/chitin deacetylase (PgdA/CDA1 family)
MGLMLRAVSAVYASPPVLRATNAVITNYVFHGRRLTRASVPVCQIFAYHRVNDDHDPFLYATPTGVFKRQVEYLARRFPIVSLDDVVNGKAWRYPYSCAITLDDGYRDNYLNAFPVLSALKIPATIFLATGYVEENRLPWYDQVALGLKLTTRKHLDLSALGGPVFALDSLPGRAAWVDPTRMWLRRMSESQRETALTELFGQLGVSPSLNLREQMLHWTEVQSMARGGVTFGAHTVTHPCLAGVSGNRAREEITNSKKAIECRLQEPVRFFAYPFGGALDFTAETKAAVAEAGFSAAVTTVWGFNGPTQDRIALFRCGTWESNHSVFALKLDWYRFTAASRQSS